MTGGDTRLPPRNPHIIILSGKVLVILKVLPWRQNMFLGKVSSLVPSILLRIICLVVPPAMICVTLVFSLWKAGADNDDNLIHIYFYN